MLTEKLCMKTKRRISKNKKGGIEGLPLQLMIIIMVATLGTAIIVGWMGSIETPHSIGEVNVITDNVEVKNGLTTTGIELYVYDQDGNPVKNATVVLSGLGVYEGSKINSTVHTTTDANGYASFNSRLHVNLSGVVGHLTVTVSSSDYGESTCKVPVVNA